MRRRTKLSTRILVSQLALLIGTMVIGFALYAWQTYRILDGQYEQRALTTAAAVAALPQVQQALVADPAQYHPSPANAAVQRLATEVQNRTGALYVVIINPAGFRLTHPDPALVGANVNEPVAAMDGRSHADHEPGSLGLGTRGRVPVFANGRAVGEVSAGILEQQVWTQLFGDLPALATYLAVALSCGVLGSVLLTRGLKRTTFGLELHEIADLLSEREAMLHGIREGVITLRQTDEVTLVNDEARRLLGLHTSALGQPLSELLPDGRLRDVLSGKPGGTDQVVLADEHCLIVNRTPVSLRGRELGYVITLRDRTEAERLTRELTSTRGLTDALRAQQHEFANRMHTVLGLISLGEADEAARYLTEAERTAHEFAESVSTKIHSRVVAALITAKTTVAAERDVTLLLTEDSRLDRRPVDQDAVITILGNLIDNAIDAARLGPPPAHVTVRLAEDDESLLIRVSDTGPGVPPEIGEAIFQEGISTKQTERPGGRGLGLALVDQVVRRLGGSIEVTSGPAPAFTVMLPAHRPTEVTS